MRRVLTNAATAQQEGGLKIMVTKSCAGSMPPYDFVLMILSCFVAALVSVRPAITTTTTTTPPARRALHSVRKSHGTN